MWLLFFWDSLALKNTGRRLPKELACKCVNCRSRRDNISKNHQEMTLWANVLYDYMRMIELSSSTNFRILRKKVKRPLHILCYLKALTELIAIPKTCFGACFSRTAETDQNRCTFLVRSDLQVCILQSPATQYLRSEPDFGSAQQQALRWVLGWWLENLSCFSSKNLSNSHTIMTLSISEPESQMTNDVYTKAPQNSRGDTSQLASILQAFVCENLEGA